MATKNPIIEYLEAWTLLNFGEAEKHFMTQRMKDARPVECVRMQAVFNAEQMDYLRQYYRPRQRMCYKNASELLRLIAEPGGASWLFPEPAFYVEGFVHSNALFPIEHAFVKIGDRYIDPTFERALKRDPRQEMYVSLIEIAPRELLKLEGETGYYGEMYRYSYLKRFRPDLAERMRGLNPNGK